MSELPGRDENDVDARGREAAVGPRLSLATRVGYGVGSIGTGIYATVPGLLLLYYMTDTLGVPAALAGVGIFLPKFWDVITDPLMGSISDRTHSRWGRRRPYLLAGALTLPLCFAALFSAPALGSPMLSFAWVMLAYILAATAFTVFCVPYTAMPAEMSDDYHEVTSLMGWRIALMTVGVLVSGAMAPQLVALGGGGRPGYTLMSMVIAAVLLASMLTTFFGTRRAPSRPRLEQTPPFREQLRAALEVRPFRVLIIGYAAQLIGVGLILATVPYFARYLLAGDDDTMTILFVALVLPAFATMPAWVYISRRTGKLPAYLASTVLLGVGAASLWFASPDMIGLVYAQVALMGVGWAGTQLFPFSMLPDTITVDRQESGQRREGVFTGLWMAVDKGAMAVGSLLAGFTIDLGGFIESEGGVLVSQPDSALAAIRWGVTLLPALFLLLSLPILWRYRGHDLGRDLAQEVASP